MSVTRVLENMVEVSSVVLEEDTYMYYLYIDLEMLAILQLTKN